MANQPLQSSKVDTLTTQNIDFHQRRITNAHPSIDDYDYVVRKELKDLQGGGQEIKRITPAGVNLNTATLLIKDTTVGNDIADHIPVYTPGVGVRIIGILRKTVASDLVIRIKKGTDMITFTIPSTTAKDVWIKYNIGNYKFMENEVITWDITASDGSKDATGVATIVIVWS